MKVLMGIDDMDVFKGIELKLQAMELLLEQHREWVGKLVLVQVRPWFQHGVGSGSHSLGLAPDRLSI